MSLDLVVKVQSKASFCSSLSDLYLSALFYFSSCLFLVVRYSISFLSQSISLKKSKVTLVGGVTIISFGFDLFYNYCMLDYFTCINLLSSTIFSSYSLAMVWCYMIIQSCICCAINSSEPSLSFQCITLKQDCYSIVFCWLSCVMRGVLGCEGSDWVSYLLMVLSSWLCWMSQLISIQRRSFQCVRQVILAWWLILGQSSVYQSTFSNLLASIDNRLQQTATHYQFKIQPHVSKFHYSHNLFIILLYTTIYTDQFGQHYNTRLTNKTISINRLSIKMQSAIINTETVDIYCFACTYPQLHQQIQNIQTQIPLQDQHKIIKIIIFVLGLTLLNYSDTQIALKNTYKQFFKQYSINLLMLNSLEEFKASVQQIQTANGHQYENNYLQLQKISEKALRNKVLQKYLQKKFKWSQVKANYFIDRHKVNSLSDVLKYEGYPQWQKTTVSKTVAFHEFCTKRQQEFLFQQS